MFQIAAVGLICAVLSLAVRSWRPEFSIYISAASGLVLFAMVYSQLEGIISGVSGLFQKSGSAGVYFPVLLKVIGIAYLTDFSAQVCRDAGEKMCIRDSGIAVREFIFRRYRAGHGDRHRISGSASGRRL